MKRHELEHVLRAAGSITDETDFVVMGSQAILGTVADPLESLLGSLEVHLYPRNNPEISDLIGGSIGNGSPFHETFGYYGQGADLSSVTLAKGWKQRLAPFSSANTRGVIGWCLSPEDLAFCKLAAGSKEDLDYVSELLNSKVLNAEGVRSLGLSPEVDQQVESRLQSAEKV